MLQKKKDEAAKIKREKKERVKRMKEEEAERAWEFEKWGRGWDWMERDARMIEIFGGATVSDAGGDTNLKSETRPSSPDSTSTAGLMSSHLTRSLAGLTVRRSVRTPSKLGGPCLLAEEADEPIKKVSTFIERHESKKEAFAPMKHSEHMNGIENVATERYMVNLARLVSAFGTYVPNISIDPAFLLDFEGGLSACKIEEWMWEVEGIREVLEAINEEVKGGSGIGKED